MGIALGPMLVLVVLLAAVAVPMVLRACWLPRGMGKKPACGNCGYDYAGWGAGGAGGAAKCPECGMEVRQAGVVTPRLALKMRGGVFSAAVGLLVVVAFVGIVASILVERAVTARGYVLTRGSYLLRPTMFSSTEPPREGTGLGSGPGPEYAVEITIRREAWANRVEQGVITVVVAPKIAYDMKTGTPDDVATEGFAKAIIHRPNGPIDLYDPQGVQTGSVMVFDRAVAAGLFKAAGLDVPDPRGGASTGDGASGSNPFIATGIDSLTDLVQKEISTPGTGAGVTSAVQGSWNTIGRLNITGGGTHISSGLRAMLSFKGYLAAMGVWVALWVGVYVVSLVWVVRRRRGLMEGVAAGPTRANAST